METEVRTYWENTQKPWGKLFYQGVWEQLPPWQGKRLLDFGSGFGITAAHLGEHNQVTAVELNRELLALSVGEGTYRQLVGGVEQLAALEEGSFDGIVCHNVLEYAPQRQEILREFARLLGPEGTLSVVKHNLPGRVLQKAVFENRLEEAAALLEGGSLQVRNFGQVHYYQTEDLVRWAPGLEVRQVLGVRIFFGLPQDNAAKEDPAWQQAMLRLEAAAAGREPYRQMAFFHHVLLRPRQSPPLSHKTPG